MSINFLTSPTVSASIVIVNTSDQVFGLVPAMGGVISIPPTGRVGGVPAEAIKPLPPLPPCLLKSIVILPSASLLTTLDVPPAISSTALKRTSSAKESVNCKAFNCLTPSSPRLRIRF